MGIWLIPPPPPKWLMENNDERAAAMDAMQAHADAVLEGANTQNILTRRLIAAYATLIAGPSRIDRKRAIRRLIEIAECDVRELAIEADAVLSKLGYPR